MIPPTAFPSNLAPDPEDNIIMLQVSDLMAEKWGVSREECDAYALRSQMLAKQAMEGGFLDNQVVPVVIPATKKTPEVIVAKDEHPRPQTTAEGLAKLKAIYEGGVTTAGNASGRNDGGGQQKRRRGWPFEPPLLHSSFPSFVFPLQPHIPFLSPSFRRSPHFCVFQRRPSLF